MGSKSQVGLQYLGVGWCLGFGVKGLGFKGLVGFRVESLGLGFLEASLLCSKELRGLSSGNRELGIAGRPTESKDHPEKKS